MNELEEIALLVCRNNLQELAKINDEEQRNMLTGINFSLPYYFIFFFFLISNFRSDHYLFSTIGTLDDKSLFILPSDYISLLHIAAYCDSLESFIFLNNIGISIDQKSVNSYLSIHYACLSESYEIVAYILSIDSHQHQLFHKWNIIKLT